MARHRIAFVDYFPPHYRRRLYEEIAARLDADFYFFSDERERWHNDRIAIAYEGEYRRVDLWRIRVAGEGLLPGITHALSSKRYDAVVKSLNGRLMLPLTYLTARARGVPFVLWTGMWHHPTTRFHKLSRPLTEAIYRRCDAIVAYGDHVKEFLCAVPGVDGDKVYVAGQAVDSEIFERAAGERLPGAEILFVGQFEERKGVELLIDAFGRLDAPQAQLRLIGSGPLEPEIRRAAAASSRIEMVGHVSQEDLPAQLARSRCLVLPSVTTALDREPWGLVINEAMHAGLPVIVSDAVGAAAGGLVRDGQNGYVVPERDIARLAEAIGHLALDRELADRLGAQAREDARAFDYRRMGDAFEAAVEHAISSRKPALAGR